MHWTLHSWTMRLAGTALGVALVIHNVAWTKAFEGLHHMQPGWAMLAVALTGLGLMGSVFVWGMLLRSGGHHFRWRRLGSWYLQSMFVAQLLPAGVGGDAMRAVEVGKVTGPGHALASLCGSRMAATLGMAAWGVAGAVLLRALVGPWAVAAACAFFVAMVIAWTLALAADRVVRHLRHHDSGLRRRVHRFLGPFCAAFHSYRRAPHFLVQCLIVGGLGWGLNLLALAVFARSIGADVSWSLFAVSIPVSLLATLAPFSINGLGLREGVLAGLLAHGGISAGHAGALTILVDLQLIPFALLGAFLWTRRRREWAAPPMAVPALT